MLTENFRIVFWFRVLKNSDTTVVLFRLFFRGLDQNDSQKHTGLFKYV